MSEPLLPTPTGADTFTGNLKSSQQKDTTKHSVNLSQALNHPLFSQQASLASQPARQDEERERQITVGSGLKLLRSSKPRNPDSLFSKMLVGYLLSNPAWYSNKCALIWKHKVTKANVLLFQLSPSMRRTEGIGSGLLLTPRVLEVNEDPKKFVARNGDRTEGCTPNLTVQIAMLPTPNASEAAHGGPNARDSKGAPHLSSIVAMLPTPDANIGNRGQAKEWKGTRPSGAHQQKKLNDLNAMTGTRAGLKLQPNFVAWMMGYPLNWLDFPTEEKSATPNGDKKH